MLTVGDTLPAFSLTAQNGTDLKTAFETVTDQTYAGQWKVLFFWPKDFTFVCPTEIVGFNDLQRDFADRDTVVIGASTDTDFVHLAWRQSREDLSRVSFPWLADSRKDLAGAMGVLDKAEGVALRATFVIDPQNIIRHVSVNDMSVGRNPKEILRILDALQTDELCPCNWQQGQDVIQVAA